MSPQGCWRPPDEGRVGPLIDFVCLHVPTFLDLFLLFFVCVVFMLLLCGLVSPSHLLLLVCLMIPVRPVSSICSLTCVYLVLFVYFLLCLSFVLLPIVFLLSCSVCRSFYHACCTFFLAHIFSLFLLPFSPLRSPCLVFLPSFLVCFLLVCVTRTTTPITTTITTTTFLFLSLFLFLSYFFIFFCLLLPPSSTTVLAGIWRRVGTGILLRRRLPRSLGTWAGFAPLTQAVGSNSLESLLSQAAEMGRPWRWLGRPS